MSRVDLKIVLLGHEAVGKTSLMQRFVNDRFNESLAYQNTIGSAFASKEVQVGDKKLVLGVWDTAGSERYQAMAKIYYRGAAAAIVCYDVTNPETFSRAKFWMRELRSVEENCTVYLCATKKDLLESVEQANPSLETVEEYADGVQSKFFLTSSKTGENVVEIFNVVAEDYISNPLNASNLGDFITLVDEHKHSKCCPL
ncbi:ras-related protein Rab-24 [Nasonia vitripennis]|uniref:Uncharacterized protein n=1 Tax=Nasonia vitripennis TaxID=7425 RepID=A0A7M7LJJ5_NASVI|nr:ras-related protein Rab-24 [Nasonia vitripennis]